MRKARRMDQQQLGQWAEIRKTVVSDIECGRRNLTLASLEGLARGLNCCESQLLLPVARSSLHSAPAQPGHE